jgi:hypothetical protein
MVLGHLKVLDRAGDRAIAYGKAMRELLDAESGLDGWMHAFAQRSSQRKLVWTLSVSAADVNTTWGDWCDCSYDTS